MIVHLLANLSCICFRLDQMNLIDIDFFVFRSFVTLNILIFCGYLCLILDDLNWGVWVWVSIDVEYICIADQLLQYSWPQSITEKWCHIV